ncbi:C39 family peptidase [Saccharothrix sp. S26]|uniref:C39 family peptidase n=1 Tax=Saccharothrix sp. S26 TaxID=2907215 RepID=UPI001F426276|nr:C39 family peptidase [Saccharothrix sp. S26]MCE6993719.1 C39 family peptidase [Saccharothrix sp. S26]
MAVISAALVALVAPGSASATGEDGDFAGAPALSAEAAWAQYELDSKNGRGAELAKLKKSESPANNRTDAATRSRVAAKDKAALAHLEEKKGSFSALGVLTLWWQQQETDFWCGPATVSMITNARGVGMGQDEAARQLGTTVDGTPWSSWGGLGSPVRSVLNSRLNTGWYEVKPLSSWPTGSEIRTYEANLVYNIDRGWHLAGNVYEVKGSQYRLNGHPSDRTIWHWVPMYAYDHSGETTYYADPASGTGNGFQSVAQYNYISSLTIAVAMGERGYIA